MSMEYEQRQSETIWKWQQVRYSLNRRTRYSFEAVRLYVTMIIIYLCWTRIVTDQLKSLPTWCIHTLFSHVLRNLLG